MGCTLLFIYNKLPSPKEISQEEKNEVYMCEPNEILFLTSQPTFSVDCDNGEQFQKLSSNDQCLLEGESKEDYNCCVWYSNFNYQTRNKDGNSFNLTKK